MIYSWFQKLFTGHARNNSNLYLVAAIFCLSRAVYFFYFNIRFDASPLPQFIQYIDPQLLRQHLLQSVYYLHSQPPLFNLFLGVGLHFFPQHYAIFFHLTYIVLGLMFTISLFLIMQEIGVIPLVNVLLTSLFMISPIVVEYENWLFYEYPTAVILTLSLLFLYRFTVHKKIRDGFIFFLLLALTVYIRGMLSLYWFLFVAASLSVINMRAWKEIVRCCLIPVLLILALYVKNFMVFHTFSISDVQIGINLASTVTSELPENIADTLIAQKKITGLYKVSAFNTDLSAYRPYGIQVRKTGIPLLDQELKSTGWFNEHNLIYLDAAQVNIRDASYVLRHYPWLVLKQRGMVLWENYFLPSDECAPFYKGGDSGQWRGWDDSFKKIFL